MVQQNKANKNATKGRGVKSAKIQKVKQTIVKGAKGAVKGARVGVAAAKLAEKMLNPVKVGKMVANAARGKGIVLPGSNYIGPGNPMGRKVKSKGDALAKKHD